MNTPFLAAFLTVVECDICLQFVEYMQVIMVTPPKGWTVYSIVTGPFFIRVTEVEDRD